LGVTCLDAGDVFGGPLFNLSLWSGSLDVLGGVVEVEDNGRGRDEVGICSQ
jgi:hypothetical protein